MVNVVEVGTVGFERVVRITDDASGLDAIVAVHNINLGPAMGGCRAMKYDSFNAHMDDALNLAKGMTYKNALAGLPLGGGKAAINCDGKDLTDDMLTAFAEGLNILNKNNKMYSTAGDIGTTVAHLAKIAETTEHVVAATGSDSGTATAYGVLSAMRGAIRFLGRDITKETVSVTGLGKVGWRLAEFLIEEGASVVASDVNIEMFNKFKEKYSVPGLVGVTSVGTAHSDGAIWAPCAVGGALNDITANSLMDNAIVCGGANNQLADPYINNILTEKNITYVPDYLANAGGVIIIHTRNQLHEDVEYDHPSVLHNLNRIADTTHAVLEEAAATGRPTSVVADDLAEEIFMN